MQQATSLASVLALAAAHCRDTTKTVKQQCERNWWASDRCLVCTRVSQVSGRLVWLAALDSGHYINQLSPPDDVSAFLQRLTQDERTRVCELRDQYCRFLAGEGASL